ncbi:MAG: DNA mismatch repair endonuclease MutL [Candidatus Cloacimonetes bacterium]|jgi:DNA mismatch repair protein MutL|nr:DNA mismatch repair endonuclease MutL [Candidatus Cloacimonadota bacterium]
MGRIKVLPEEVANRIAAGEVIERPVSVVKELVENSIDARSSQITVHIEKGGKKLIRIIDNGRGMSEDDALQAFERHATSKIKTVTDIFNISTLGFRGEALPSIASVSQLILISKDAESDTASRVEFRGGKLTDFSKTSANKGTTITVRNLFSNVPARRKFLKSDPVEFKHILNYLHYQSILYPHIHIRFLADGKEKLNYPAVAEMKARMTTIFGSDFLKRDLIEVSEKGHEIELSGFISGLNEEKEGFADYKYLFVNGRYIRDKIVLHSLKSAYGPFIKKLRIFQQGKTPPYILFLKVDPHHVDFNVHPAKMEIRFRDPGKVHTFIKLTIEKLLLQYEDDKFKQIKNKISTTFQPGRATDVETRIFSNKMEKKHFNQVKKELKDIYQPDLFRKKTNDDIQIEKNFTDNRTDFFLRPEEDVINPWQLHQSYIFVQVEEGLMIIDQHAAHERIIYEKILHRIHGAPAQTQKLLFPIVIDLPPHLTNTIPELISENIEVFNKIGFSIKTFSGDSIVIDEIPIELEDWDGGDIFIDIIKQLEDEFEQTEDFRDSLSKSVACKAAIKAGRKMNRKEMLALINDLFACEVPYFCPHGRPLIIKMTMPEFEKKFKRTT